MSFHNHEPEEYNKRFGVEERKKQAERNSKLAQSIIDDTERMEQVIKQKVNAEIQKDIDMLDRLKEFDLNEKDIKWIFHLAGLPNKQMLINYIQARTGSAILHYINKHVEKMPLGNFNERNI